MRSRTTRETRTTREGRARAWPALPALLLLAATPLLTAGATSDPTATDPDAEPAAAPTTGPTSPEEATPSDGGESVSDESPDDSASPAGAACPALPPLDEPTTSSLEADVDGDGALDHVVTYIDEGSPTVRLELAAGGGDVADVGVEGSADTAVVGAVDIDRDGDREVVTRFSDFDPFAVYGFLTLDDCKLYSLPSSVDNEPVGFAVGQDLRPDLNNRGRIVVLAGVECREGREDVDVRGYYGFVEESSIAADGTVAPNAAVTVEVEDYRLDVRGTPGVGGLDTLTKLGTTNRTIAASDPEFDELASLRCGTLRIGDSDGDGPSQEPVPVPSGGIQTGMGGLAAGDQGGTGLTAGPGIPAALAWGLAAAGLTVPAGLWLTRRRRSTPDAG